MMERDEKVVLGVASQEESEQDAGCREAFRLALDDAKPLYFLPRDKVADEVLIPGFGGAASADCMMGFFSSGALADLAPGLATYIRNAQASFRLIISPFLSEADQQAMREGLRKPEEIAGDLLAHVFVSVNDLQRHTLKCLSYLLSNRRIELKVALMKDALFHPKVWLFNIGAGTVAAHGSSNMTSSGVRKNYEQITVSKSWADPTQRYLVEKLEEKFQSLWQNFDDDCVVLQLSEAIRQNILRDYPVDRPPTEEEFRELYNHAVGTMNGRQNSDLSLPGRPVFAIPAWLKYDEGAYAHQGAAARAWVEAGFKGTLEMATGSGKTLTSIVCAHRLYERHKPLLMVIAAPYIPLIDQWCGEVALFGLRPVNLTVLSGPTARERALQQVRRRMSLGLSDVEVVIVSHDTLCTGEFAKAVSGFSCVRLLIADEAHNLGRPGFLNDPPAFFEYRLALSATPVRQYDPEGTDAVFDFFGPVVFQFTLKDAIGRCLVEYDYFVHPIALTESEMDEWNDLTARIRKLVWRQSDAKPDDYLAKLLRDRRALLETAAAKIGELSRLLDREDLRSVRHTLIYATDKSPDQLDMVNALLNRKGVLFHQLTAEETGNRELTARIIRAFQEGEIQVLTAKRVLDEGVNIPQVCRAYILASTTVERQWIQRRGRLLRTCAEIGKTHSIIHDFIALPPSLSEGLDDDARGLVRSELRRIQEFASLARNAGKPDGPLALIRQIADSAFA
jgi:superfamily II DNA or RNA helicase/HKD family nuclease